MDECIFCQVAAGKLPGTFVYQDDDIMVIKDIHPQAPVHLLVIPKKHVNEFMDADDALLGRMLAVTKKVIAEEKVTGYRLVANSLETALIGHLHLHILGKIDKFRAL